MASVGRLLQRFWQYVVFCYEKKVWRAKEVVPTDFEMGPARPRGYIEFPSHGGFANAAYYAGWGARWMEAPSRMDIRFISHVYYAFAWLKRDGTVYLHDEQVELEMDVNGYQGCIRALAALKQNHPHLRLLLSIGGGGPGGHEFPRVANDPNARERFAASALNLVQTYGFDGVDVDWEHPVSPKDGENFLELFNSLRRNMPAPRYMVTTALAAGQWALRNLDLTAVQERVDYVNLMAYDFSGRWEHVAGHHAQLYTPRFPHSEAALLSGHSAVEYLLHRGVDPAKIILGIPLYGRSFEGASVVGDRFNRLAENPEFDYKYLPRHGAMELEDLELGAACCSGGVEGFVSYDSRNTAKMKARYVKSRKLGGLFYWTATGDRMGEQSLIEMCFMTLHHDDT